MSNGITLTSAMRNNLGALKYLSGQMDITQTRLATGQKVNSAIDNASSFYQARALTNRASDLDRLLDSMGQSIQTINAAIGGLEHAGATLEQAAVVAQQAYEAAIIPEKAWFEAQVGENGAVVSTAQELKDAIDSGKETICVYGKIDLGEITSTISLKNNQKLVGIGYFGDFDSETEKWSSINGIIGKSSPNDMITTENSLISDLTIKTTSSSGSVNVINSEGKSVFNNIDICIDNRRTDSTVYDFSGIATKDSLSTISGISTIRTVNTGKRSMLLKGYYTQSGGGFKIADNSRLSLFNGHINVYNAKLKVGKNAEVYSSRSVNSSLYLAHIDLQASSKFIMKQGKITSSYIAMKEGAEFIRENKLYKANESFDKVAIVAESSYTEEFLSKVDVYQKDIDYSHYDITNTQSKAKDGFGLLLESAVQYGEMMNVYDDMIKDSSYQGINLLTGGNLTTMFNETRSNSFKVEGANMTAESLGITTREWQTKEDIAQSIKEIKDAMYKVRDMVEVLGNNLSIIETRMNFTDALTDIYKLVLMS